MKSEFSIFCILIVLLILFLDPFGVWMPAPAFMMLLFILVVVFLLFAGFLWRERVRDEREAMHRMLADRFAFLAGSAMLVLGIVLQGLRHHLDIWLVITLGVMILAKIGGFIYGKIKH